MKKVNILLVDDDESICDSLSKLLIKRGYSVETKISPVEALKSLRKSSYDILLSDLKMPEMDGIELLREARKIDPGLGVIMMTGFGEITSYLEAMDLGAAEYMNKPIKSDELEVVIKKLVKRKKKVSKQSAHSKGEPSK